MKTPLLDQLRATTERQEKEIQAPVIDRLNRLNNQYTELWKEKNRIAKIATSDFGKHILNEFVHKFSKVIRDEFVKAIGNGTDDVFYVPVSKNMLKMMTPESFERYCLMYYAQHMDEKADLGVSGGTVNSKIQVLHINIPKLDIHKVVTINDD